MIELWNTVLLEPMMNFLLVLSKVFGGSFGLAVVALTILVNLLILPLTLRQTRSAKAMQSLQPKMREIQKKYAKDKQKLQSETMKLYKESGINPLGCAVPLLIQMPIWIAVYQSVIQTLATTPERIVGLSDHLYSWSIVHEAVPPKSNFLWMDLAYPNFLIVILIMATMWLTQKMSTTPSTDPQQQQMQTMMQWGMPLMFGFIFLNFPSGLALYIVTANIFRMIVQITVNGAWKNRAMLFPAKATPGAGAKEPKRSTPQKGSSKGVKGKTPSDKIIQKKADTTAEKANLTEEEGITDGSSRRKRKKRRRSR